MNTSKSRGSSGRSMRDDLRALSAAESNPKQLRSIDPVGPAAAQRGISVWNENQAQNSGGGGVSGDLVEDPDSREYYNTTTVIPDGVYFAYLVSPVKKLTFTDGGGNVLTASLEFPDYPVGLEDG